MSSKTYDLTIFGATGLTGKHIVQHLLSFSTSHGDKLPSDFRWAVAGRNESALNALLDELTAAYSQTSFPRPDVLVANVTRRESLDKMAKASKVIVNAVGPFRFMGEYVVRSCVENGCDYVDITGEPEFIERMQRTYHEQAARRGVTIVHACGFDSVPSDMGVLFVKRLYAERGWTPAHVEMFLRVYCGPAGLRAGYATFESAVHGFSSVEVLREIRKVSGLQPLPRPGPDLVFHNRLKFDSQLRMYHVPFQFADPSVVRLSQQLFISGFGNPPKKTNEPMPPTVQFAAYLLLPNLWIVILYQIYTFIFGFLAASPWGRNLLLNHPEGFTHGVFSKDGPTEQHLRETSFEMILRSKGYESNVIMDGPPDKSLTVVVRGPEMGYVATSRIVLQCALTTLLEKEAGNIPSGVLTPSPAFWNTHLIDRLQSEGIEFNCKDSS